MDETQNDAPFVAFYDMHAVTFVPPDEMADVTIAGRVYLNQSVCPSVPTVCLCLYKILVSVQALAGVLSYIL